MANSLNKLFIEKALYPAMEALKGNNVRSYTSELVSGQGKSAGELDRDMEAKLAELLIHCKRHVPAYSETGLSEQEIAENPRAAIRKIPVLTKKLFRESSERYLASGTDKSALIPNRTGGSTGEPLLFYMDRYSVEHYEAARWRGLSWFDISFGSRSVMIWGNPVELTANEQKKTRIKEKWLKNRVVLSAYEMSDERIHSDVSFINSYKPEYLYGYATALYGFVSLMKKQGLRLDVQLKAAVSTSETLHDYQRELIGEVLGCPVTNEYGARDGGIIGYECRHGSMHLTTENVYMEIVDPLTYEPLPHGKSGLVLITDLTNRVMPRLRYVLGDMATLTESRCSCGLNHPVISSVDGREDDLFKLPGGVLVHGNVINQLTRKYVDRIAQFRLTQTAINSARLDIVPVEGASRDMSAFVTDITEVMPGVEIALNFTDSIPPTASGKTRYAVREIEL